MSIVSASNKPDSTSTPTNEYRLYTYSLVEDKPVNLTLSKAGLDIQLYYFLRLGMLNVDVDVDSSTSVIIIVTFAIAILPLPSET